MSAAAYMVKIPSEPGVATPPSPAEPELTVGAHANFKVPFIFLRDLCVPPKKKKSYLSVQFAVLSLFPFAPGKKQASSH